MHPVSQQRILWPDVVRIIAIFFIIQIHASIQVSSSPTIFNRLDLMGVPLFVLLSGTLLLGKQETYTTFFRKRCVKVLIPWIIWTILYMAYFYTMHHTQVHSDFFADHTSFASQWFHFFFRTFMSSLWFLPMIFSIYLLTPLLRIIVRHATRFDIFYILILWFLFFSVLPYFVLSPLFPRWEPNVIFAPLQFSGYFLLGYVVIKNDLLRKYNLPVLFLISILPFLVLLFPFKTPYVQDFTAGYIFPGIVIASVFFFYFLYAACNKIENAINLHGKRIIALISGASFGVYVSNEMFIDYFKNVFLSIPFLSHSEFSFAILTFLVISLVVIVLQRIPILKYSIPQ